MKKTLGILLIFLVFITGYFYFNKPQRAQFRGVTALHLVYVTPDAAELRGELIFHNPNKMRSQLGKVKFDVLLNEVNIGQIDEGFSTAIKGEEDFHFAFQVRFPVAGIAPDDTTNIRLPLAIHGSAGSDVLFANYTFPIDYAGTIDWHF